VLALSAGWISNKHTHLSSDGKTTGWPKYGHGWTNRNIDLTQKCLALAGGK
jgi:hypothetical protein